MIIDYQNVEIQRNELTTLKNVTFGIEPGEFVYLLGRVGSGKTSLMKSLYAEVPIAAGSARIFDYDLTDIKARDIPMLRRRIGIVFQDFQLLPDRSAYDNLDFVLRATGWDDADERRSRIDAVVAEVGMTSKVHKMPHHLSGGEQQRIVMARALLNKPGLILADEPTGNLDPETGELIMTKLKAIASEGVAVIVATHNHGFLQQFPGRVLRCERKQLIEA